MEYTENFNFALPSRDTDDIADINQISENFKKLDGNFNKKVLECVDNVINGMPDEYEYIDQDTEGFWKIGYIRVNGTIKEGTVGYKYAAFLPVSEYTVEEINIVGKSTISSVAYYDKNEGYISSQVGGTITSITIPENAYYMSFSLIDDDYTTNVFVLKHKIVSGTDGLADEINQNKQSIDALDERLTVAEKNIENLQKYDNVDLKTDGGYTNIFRTIGVIGDSLSSGEMTHIDASGKKTNIDMYEYSWLQYIARACGSTGYNFSQGGLSTKTFLNNEGGHADACYGETSPKCQAYFIALGHNDHNQSIPTGTRDDIGTNADTFYRYYAEIIQKLQNVDVAPKAKIFVITMKNNYKMESYAEYNEAIRDIATIFDNVYVLDMNEYFPDRPDEHITNGHANAMGYYQYSLEIQTLVDKVIRENLDEFMYVQFINTRYQ